ncbi:hypothetical protein HJFPF1_12287 [Paramyrothecium foliicola]|nr:hypothetical protein HJFPF1_12287 [Paramyrothecium foliicola]
MYSDRRINNYSSGIGLTSMDILAFSTFAVIPALLTQPPLLIAGSKADTKIYSDEAIDLSKGPKKLFAVEGATNVSLYDRSEHLNQAFEKLASGSSEPTIK